MNASSLNRASSIFLALGMAVSACQAETMVYDPGQHTYFNFSPKEDGFDGGNTLKDGSVVYYCQNAHLGGYDLFGMFKAEFPALMFDKKADAPRHIVVDMAYAKKGTLSFKNVTAAADGRYTITFRYAFGGGLFPALHDRPMGIKVNGTVVNPSMHFPRTAGFDSFKTASIEVDLKKGRNAIEVYNISDHGVSRLDTMTVSKVPAVPVGTG